MRNYHYPFEPPVTSQRRLAVKLRWREADQRRDAEGKPAILTLWAAEARGNLFELLSRTMDRDELFRIRHRYHDEPCLLVRESRFRELERRAARSPIRQPPADADGEPTKSRREPTE